LLKFTNVSDVFAASIIRAIIALMMQAARVLDYAYVTAL
jgi:hypothetical protein